MAASSMPAPMNTISCTCKCHRAVNDYERRRDTTASLVMCLHRTTLLRNL